MSLQSGRPTGVDRVCLAYLKALCDASEPCFGLVRTKLGFVLLDDAGAKAMLARLSGKVPWGTPDMLSRVLHKPNNYRRITEAELRRFCIARCRPNRLSRMLQRYLPDGVVYVNVDHANATERVLWSVKSVPKARVTLFLHDTIPLDFPQYQTPLSVKKFEKFLMRAQRFADMILCNSQVSKEDVQRHMANWGDVPPIHVAHLGLDERCFQIDDNPSLPEELKAPYFVALGTIEPRKNHGLLLDLWAELEASAGMEVIPTLVICGRRGWMNEDVFARLDQIRKNGRHVLELNQPSDAYIAALLKGSAGLVFPSLAEGYGLPPIEAAALGVPVLCNDLPVLREVLGDYPVYASVTDSYAWKEAIIDLAQRDRNSGSQNVYIPRRFDPPNWQSHFNIALKVT
ncbi:glycosyltransferase family 1 protein [Shimia sp. SDUM112013]|uniref:glycosyltransferase family 4 protein n=1 Tax=Shimia sp. SDUM112013 TaxID=3136160 RepID=UPI0032EB026A